MFGLVEHGAAFRHDQQRVGLQVAHKFDIMRYSDDSAVVVAQRLTNDIARQHIKVGRWLVEDEEIGPGQDHFRQGQARLLATTQGADLLKDPAATEQEASQYCAYASGVFWQYVCRFA